MKASKYILLSLAIIVIAVVGYRFMSRKGLKNTTTGDNLKSNLSTTMKISSPSFENNGDIPAKYTCDGENVSPPLKISDAPAGAKSLALILHDSDAPAADGFTHWVMFNINPATNEISENSAPENAVQGTSSAGSLGYASPCPPTGTHHYEFRLYALDTKLSLESSAKKSDVEEAMEGHIIDQVALIGLYKR